LQVDPDYVGVLNGKGYSQEQLAHLLMEQGEQEEALSLYRAAVDSYNAALAIDQSLQVVKGHKERVLQQLEQMGVEY
jgi:DNA-binding SARP family transcriptional activator